MDWIGVIASYLGIGCAVGLFIYWGVGLGRILITSQRVPTARAGIELARANPPTEPVCVIVPAHNEAHAIADVIRSLRAQDHRAMRVVLALDRCTDSTEDVAREAVGADPRFEIIRITECPPGWAGKVHAVWTGVTRSVGAKNAAYLLFIDADTELDPACVSGAHAMMRDRSLDMLSYLSTLSNDRWYETLVQPAASLELLRQYPLMQASRDEGRRPFANGQFMMFLASAYHAIETHEAVKDELLEDLALARRIEQARMRAGVFVAAGVMRCRMYESWPAFRRGWKRIYTEAARRRPSKLRRAAGRVVIPGAILPAFAMLGIVGSAIMFAHGDIRLGSIALGVCSIALGVFFAAIALAYRAGGAPLWAVPGYLAGAVLASRILKEAAADLEHNRPTEWGGIRYQRQRQ
jgi:hypothetical protein